VINYVRPNSAITFILATTTRVFAIAAPPRYLALPITESDEVIGKI